MNGGERVNVSDICVLVIGGVLPQETDTQNQFKCRPHINHTQDLCHERNGLFLRLRLYTTSLQQHFIIHTWRTYPSIPSEALNQLPAHTQHGSE